MSVALKYTARSSSWNFSPKYTLLVILSSWCLCGKRDLLQSESGVDLGITKAQVEYEAIKCDCYLISLQIEFNCRSWQKRSAFSCLCGFGVTSKISYSVSGRIGKMLNLIGISHNLGADDVIRKIRRLSVVLDTSVKEMEKDLASSDEEQFSITMDYRNILVQLQEHKALQDDRRFRLR